MLKSMALMSANKGPPSDREKWWQLVGNLQEQWFLAAKGGREEGQGCCMAACNPRVSMKINALPNGHAKEELGDFEGGLGNWIKGAGKVQSALMGFSPKGPVGA